MEVKAGYKQTEVGLIPKDWEVRRLCACAQVRSGIAKNSNLKPADPIRVHYLRVANVQDGFLDLAEMNQIEIEKADLKRFSVLPGDVLMNEGGDRDKLGRGSIWSGEFNPCVHQNHVFVIRCSSIIDPKYLTYWTRSSVAKQFFVTAGSQTTNLASINKTALGQLPISIPLQKQEQQAIANALSDADALIESLEQLIEKKRQIKQGVMQELLTGKRRLPGFCGEWEVKTLGDCVEKIVGGGTPSRTNPAFWANEVPWVTVKDFATFNPHKSQESISFIGLRNSASNLIPAGTLITSTRMLLGRAVVYEVDVAINQDLKALFLKKETSTAFLTYWFDHFGSFIDELGNGSTVKGISVVDLRRFPFKSPSLPEQTAIAELLMDIDAELAVLKQRLAKNRAIKQAMMQELLTGKVRLV